MSRWFPEQYRVQMMGFFTLGASLGNMFGIADRRRFSSTWTGWPACMAGSGSSSPPAFRRSRWP